VERRQRHALVSVAAHVLRRPPRSTRKESSVASDVYKRQSL
jgi:hypothetical protein